MIILKRKYLSHKPGLGDEYDRSLERYLILMEVAMCPKKPEVNRYGMPFCLQKRIVCISNYFPKRLLIKQNDFLQSYMHK